MMMYKFRGYWVYKNAGKGWMEIGCPIIDDKEGSKTLGIKRKVYLEFKQLEKYLKESVSAIGWVSWTHLENTHIMRFFAKLGGKPYGIDLKENKLWFFKDLSITR